MNNCPLCRCKFSTYDIPKVDRAMQQKIQFEMGEMYEERKAKLIKTGQWLENTRYIRFNFGNTFELVDF